MTDNNEMLKFMVREIATLSTQIGEYQAEQSVSDHRISELKDQNVRLLEDNAKLRSKFGTIRKDFERLLEGKASSIECTRLIKNIMGFGLKDSLDAVKSGRFSEALKDVSYVLEEVAHSVGKNEIE